MGKKLLLTLFTLVLILSGELKAQALAGGEVYYELISPLKYKITAHVYRLCEAGTLNTNNITGVIYGGTFQATLPFTRTAIKKINDTCKNPCNIQNVQSNPGFERHTFEGTIDFNLTPYKVFITNNICDVKFAVRGLSRYTATTHSTGSFHIDCGVNLCDTTVTKNHSPVFSMDPKFLAMCNQPMHYSPGPLDTSDLDSLSFEMVPLQVSNTAYVTYYTNYSSTIPLTPSCLPNNTITNCKPLPNSPLPRGFFFDNLLCNMVFTPYKCTDKAYVKIRINEYRKNPVTRKMVLIGYVTREMYMQIKSVIDNNPLSLGLNATHFNVCDKDLLFTMKTTDVSAGPTQPKADTTYLFWDNGYDKSSFQVVDTAREKSVNVTLKKDNTLTKLKTQFFTIGGYDKMCNISLVSKSFGATDNPPAQFKKTSGINSCNTWNYDFTNPDTNSFPDNIKVIAHIFDPTSKHIYASVDKRDTFTFNNNGKHIIQYYISNFPFTCNTIIYDTLNITNAFTQGRINSGNDTTVCRPYAATLKFQPYKSKGLSTIEWFSNGTLFNNKDSVITLSMTESKNIILKLTDNNGCTAESDIIYSVKEHEALLDINLIECKNTQATFTAIINSLKLPVSYKWSLNGKDTSFTGRTLDFTLRDTTLVKLTIRDSNNCVFNDSVQAYIKPSFTFDIVQDKPEFCSDSLLTLTLTKVTAITPYTVLWKLSVTDTIPEDSVVKRKFHDKTTIFMHITDANYCSLQDSFVIRPVMTPKVILPQYAKTCEGDPVNINPVYVPNSYPKTFMWKLNGVTSTDTDSVFSFNIRKGSVIVHRATNKLGCYTEDSTIIPMYARPVFNILSNINYHHAHRIAITLDKAFPSYQWFNNVYTRGDTFWANELGAPGKHTIWCNVTDNNGCNGGDTIDIFTDKLTGIKDIQDNGMKVYPNPGQEGFYIEVHEEGRMTMMNAEGKILFEQNLQRGRNLVDTYLLPVGFYFVRVGEGHLIWLKE